MASLSNSRWQNRKEHTNGSSTNRDLVEKAIRDVSEKVCLIHLSDYENTADSN